MLGYKKGHVSRRQMWLDLSRHVRHEPLLQVSGVQESGQRWKIDIAEEFIQQWSELCDESLLATKTQDSRR
jgi:uncharacterized protein HemY